jgi:hypothetical protein
VVGHGDAREVGEQSNTAGTTNTSRLDGRSLNPQRVHHRLRLLLCCARDHIAVR